MYQLHSHWSLLQNKEQSPGLICCFSDVRKVLIALLDTHNYTDSLMGLLVEIVSLMLDYMQLQKMVFQRQKWSQSTIAVRAVAVNCFVFSKTIDFIWNHFNFLLNYGFGVQAITSNEMSM